MTDTFFFSLFSFLFSFFYLNYQSMIKQWLSERMEKETQ